MTLIVVIIVQAMVIAALLIIIAHQRARLRRMASSCDDKSPIEFYEHPSRRQRAKYNHPIGKEINE